MEKEREEKGKEEKGIKNFFLLLTYKQRYTICHYVNTKDIWYTVYFLQVLIIAISWVISVSNFQVRIAMYSPFIYYFFESTQDR